MRTGLSPRDRACWLAGIAAATGAFLVAIPGRRGWFDASVYYGTVRSWLYHDGGIYAYVAPGTRYGFTYPPFAAVCMLPMALVSRSVAIAAVLVLNVAAAGAIGYWLVDPIARRHGWSRLFTWAVAGCLLAAYGPVRDTFSFGQVNLMLLAVVLA
ncbi:MAG TPA: glycosyltransferase family 87 protein, partial [Rugosimonospora sp.]|nr:glycosyltransferase family 87 protein [Rugosimonospora sp.]